GLEFADAVKIVRQRGTYMQEAVPVGTGTMAAIMGIDEEALEQICRAAADGEIVAPANYNGPGQIVIAGHATAVERAIALAKEQGAKRALLLPVSAPFHSALMTPAAQRLKVALDPISVSTLHCPVVSNVEATPNQAADRVKSLLIEQVCAPVRWYESVQQMHDLGVTSYLEIGPGKVLSGLIKRIDRTALLQNVEDVDSLVKLQG
ncbi:MAG: ACP S-malonyltransferase, partial [Desulfofustis sp.]|nr:ACP S-malonyltransferase [Desulfofustis sp.]